MAEMKKAYLNYVADQCEEYAHKCLEKCISQGIPNLQFQEIIEKNNLQRYGKVAITRLSKAAEWLIDADAEVSLLYDELITDKKLSVTINDIRNVLVSRVITRQFHYDELHLWLFEYETREYEFPNGIKWVVTLCYAMPPADPFSGCRYAHLYKVIDSEGNERIINEKLDDMISYSGIGPDIKSIDYTLGQNKDE